MSKDKKPDNTAIDTDNHLESETGKLIRMDSPEFLQWLEENNSFRFIAGEGGCNSYRARKEFLNGVHYWYAVKKVAGKLHKKFIGKPEDVTHARLCEVASVIMQPSTRSRKQPQTPTHTQHTPELEERVNELEAVVMQLQAQLKEVLVSTRNDNPAGETRGLEENNQELYKRINELTTELDNRDKQLIQLEELKEENKRLTNTVSELTTKLDNYDIQLRQLEELTEENKQLTNKVDELSRLISNRNKRLEELKAECDRITKLGDEVNAERNELSNENLLLKSSIKNKEQEIEQLKAQLAQSPVLNPQSLNFDQLGALRENFVEIYRKSIKQSANNERVVKMLELFDKAVIITPLCSEVS